MLITGSAANLTVLRLLSRSKWVFRSTGATYCSDKGEMWHGERTYGPSAKFHFIGENVGIQPPKLSKFGILLTNVLLKCDSFAQFLQNSQR